MTANCARCHSEPRHGSSELGVRCLWPREECKKCGRAYPPELVVGNACPNCKGPMPEAVDSYRQAAGLDPMQAFPSGLRMRETTISHPRIICDREACRSFVDVGHDVEEAALRSALVALGWTVQDGERAYHWCPRHDQ